MLPPNTVWVDESIQESNAQFKPPKNVQNSTNNQNNAAGGVTPTLKDDDGDYEQEDFDDITD